MLSIIFFVLLLFFNIVLALLVLLKNPRKHINVSFFLFVLFLCFWIVTNYLSNKFTDYASAFLLNKLIFVFTPYISFALLYFSLVFPKEKKKITPLILAGLLIPVLSSNVLTYMDIVITGITFLEGGGTGVVFGPGLAFYATQFLLYLVAALALFGISLFRSSGYERAQLQYLVFGISLTLGLATITNLFIPLAFNSFAFSDVGPFFTLIMIGATTYAIIRHRLMDIRFVLARSVAYTLLIAIVGSFYTIFLFFISNYFFHSSATQMQIITYTILTLFVAFTFQPLKDFLEGVTENIFFKGRYISNELILSLTRIMASTISLESVTKLTLSQLLSTMRISRGVFVVFKGHDEYVLIQEGYKEAPTFDKHDITVLSASRGMLLLDDDGNERNKEIMRKIDIVAVLPLFKDGVKEGLLLLGEKKSGDIYSQQDIQVLEIFAPEISVAIQNAKSYEEISKFNITLREEIDKATKDLQNANERLKGLDKLKDEFVSLASHELRTPMTAIKSYLWMALDGRGGKLTEKQKYYLDRAYTSVDRLINLVNEMLNISRIESGKITVSLHPIALEKVVKDVIDEVLPHANELGVTVDTIDGTSLPRVMADADKLKEVVINLIGNSLKFTPKGGKITLSFSRDGDMVVTNVKDTGAGISSENLSKLFQKFGMLTESYENSNAPTVSGTGLGLYTCKAIIELHGGKIWATSEGKGKGSEFIFSLKAVGDK